MSTSRSAPCSASSSSALRMASPVRKRTCDEPRALAQQHRKRLRADLGIERAVIAGADHVEAAGAVGDHAGEDVEPPGGALRIGGGHDLRRQREAFQQRHDVDAVGLQHRAVGEVDLVQLQLVDALGDGCAGAGQKARAHPVGDVAQPQIEARRLDLAFDKGIFRQDQARIRHRRDHAVGQNSVGVGRKRERHGAILNTAQIASKPLKYGLLGVIRWPP